MPEKKQDNIAGWAKALQELDSIPGEAGQDFTSSWNKLHSRLESKKKKIIPYWYWAAAACIVLSFSIFYLNMHRNGPAIVKKDFKKMSSNTANITIQYKKTKTPSSTEIKLPVVSKNKNIKKNYFVSKPVKSKIPVPLPDESMVALEQPDTISSIPKPIAVIKQKMRVIHINELTQQVGEQQIMVRNTDDINYRENVSRLQLGKNASDNLLKINISPTN